MKTVEPTITSSKPTSKKGEAFFQKKGENSFFGKRAPSQPFFEQNVSPFLQTKLTIGQPGDKYEQEADAMADTVVQRLGNSEQASATASSASPLLQAKCASCEEEEKLQKKEEREEQEYANRKIQTKPIIGRSLLTHSVQRKVADGKAEAQVERLHEKDDVAPESELKAQEAISELDSPGTAPASTAEPEESLTETETMAGEGSAPASAVPGSPKDIDTPAISAKSEGVTSEPTGDLQQQLNASKGGGSPLDNGTRSLMEEQMGADFSGVRVHTGSDAVGMNQALGAQAFTHGNNIYFNEGKYNPAITSGKHLLAHELTHTIQQGASVQIKSQQVSKTSQPKVQQGILGDVWDATGGKVVSGVKSGAKWAGGKVVAGAKWVGGKAKDAVMWIYEKIKNLINRGITWLENRWESLKSFASGGLDAIMNFFEGIIQFVKSPFSFIADAIMNMDAEAIRRSWSNLTGFVLNIWDGFQKVGMGLLHSVGKIWNTINGYVNKLFNGIDNLTSHWAFRKLPSSIQNIVHGLINKLRSLWNMISSGWTFIFTKIKTFVDNAFKTIRDFIKKIFNFAIDTIITGILLFGKVLVFMMDFFLNPMKYLQPLAGSMVGYLSGVEGAFPGQITKYLGGGVPATAGTATTASAPVTAVQKADTDNVIQKKDDATPKRDSATWSEIGEGVWDIMKRKWEEVKKDPLSIILNLLLDLALPIVGNVKDIIKLFKDIKKIVTKPFSASSLKDFWTSLLHLLDIPILIYNTFWTIIGRTLALPLLIASFIPHPVVKGIAILAGYALLGAMIQGELANIGHKILLLKTGNTDEEEKKDAYNRLSDSLIAFAMEIIMAILIFIVSSIAHVIKGVFNFVRSKVFKPKVSTPKPSGKGKGGGSDAPDAPDSGKKKATPEDSKSKLESTKGKDGKDLTPEEIKAEIDAFKDGKLKKSDSPDYEWEIELRNGHTWKRKKNGKWCRFSTAHCFDDVFINDREMYEHLKKEGLVTESFEDFMKTKPGGPPSGTDITAEIKSGQQTKPTGGDWKQAPEWNKWVDKGGRVIKHGDGSVTYITKDGKWVKYSSKGYPDFSNHLTHPEVKSVDLPEGFHPDRTPDYKKANEKAGKGQEWGNDPPEGYRWHHHENGKTMQLVPKAIHEIFTHAGGISKL